MNCNGFRIMVLEYNGRHIEFDIKKGVLKYRNIISPKDAGIQYPNGYFDEKVTMLSKEKIQYSKEKIMQCLSQLPFEQKLEVLPPGASRRAYLYLTGRRKRNLFYTDTHVSDRGFRVNKEPISNAFLIIYKLLEENFS